MSRREPVLSELQSALDAALWDDAERLIRTAQQMRLTHSIYGVPLHYLLADLPQRRIAAADQSAQRLMQQAKAHLDAGQIEQAAQLYAEAAALPNISLAVAERIAAAVSLIDDTNTYGAPPDPGLEQSLEVMMTQVLASIQEKQPGLLTLLRACAIALWWDESLLAALRNRDDGREPGILEKLSRFSFIFEWPASAQEAYFTLSRLARRLLLEEWDDDPSGFQEMNGRILVNLRQRLEATPPTQPAVYERLVEAHLYHAFQSDPAAGSRLLSELFQKAENEYQLEVARQYVLVLQDLKERLPSQYSAYIDYAEGWLHHLNGRESAALHVFRTLAAQPDLLPDLRARVERGMAVALVSQQNWVDAVSHYRAALVAFRAQGNQVETAETMTSIGDAYLNIATTAYGQRDEFGAQESIWSGISIAISVIGRLPLILYLVWTLGLRWDLRAIWQLGRGMDWVIARLFADAVQWFRMAQALYDQRGDISGQARTSEALGRVYLALNHPRQAATMFAQLTATSERGTYLTARARLELAEALLRQGQLTQARTQLSQALPVFVGLKHQQRIAQTQTRLGHLAVQQGEPEEAMPAYAAAVDAWQEIGNSARATDVLHSMERLARESDLAPEAQALLAQTQAKLSTRRYETRFVHPVMKWFQRLAIILFLVVVFGALWTSIRSEAGTDLGADVKLERPVRAEIVGAFRPTVGAQDERMFQQEVAKQVTPDLRKRTFTGAVALAVLVYLLLYTLLGYLLIVNTRMENVQAQQARWLQLDSRAIAELVGNRLAGDRITTLLPWDDIRTVIENNRRLLDKPIAFWSSISLLGPDRRIDVTGWVRPYEALHHLIQERVSAEAERLDVGYSLARGFFGWLLTISLLLLLGFVALIVFGVSWVNRPLPGLPYSLVDLYGLLFVGVGIPLVYWIVVQPVRSHLARIPNSSVLWLLVLATLALAGLSWLQFRVWRLPFGRPDVVLGALTLLLAGFTLFQQIRGVRTTTRRWLPGAVILIAACAAALSLWLSSQELRSFHYLAQANAHFFRGFEMQATDPKGAESEYRFALDAYERTLGLRPEAYIYNSKGNVYALLGNYADASIAYAVARSYAPNEPAYMRNLALAYHEWASESTSSATRIERYQRALREYDRLLQFIADATQITPELRTLEVSARELRAATYFDLGTLYQREQEGSPQALEHFAAARTEYEKLAALACDERAPVDECRAPAGHVGQGWSLFFLRFSAPAEGGERRGYLEDAIEAFNSAIDLNPNYTPAYNGLGWTHWQISSDEIPGNCINGIDEIYRADYIAQIEAAVEAFNRAVVADEANGNFFRTRAQLHYILSYCYPEQRIDWLTKSIDDYDLALKSDPRADWAWRQGTIYQELANRFAALTHTNDEQEALEGAYRSYLQALALKPDYVDAQRNLDTVQRHLARSDAAVVNDLLAAMNAEATPTNLLLLAEQALARGNTTLADNALSRVDADALETGQQLLRYARTLAQWATTRDPAARPPLLERAVTAAQHAIAAGVDEAEAYLILGRAHLGLEQFDQAEAALSEASARDPRDPVIAYTLGLTNVNRGDLNGARAAYERGNRAVAQLANEAAEAEKYATAIGDLLLADKDPANIAAPMVFLVVDAARLTAKEMAVEASDYFNTAEAARQREEYNRSIPLYLKALELDPHNPAYWTPLRTALILGQGMGQTESGAAVLTAILGALGDADQYETLYAIAADEIDRGVFGLAVVALDRTLVVRPDSVEAALLKARAYRLWGDRFPNVALAPDRYRRAQEAAEYALSLDPQSAEAYDILGRALRRLGQLDASVDAYLKAAELTPENVATLSALGWVSYLAGKYELAVQTFDRLQTLAPDEARYYFNQGVAYIALGDDAAAQRRYEAGIQVANLPENAEIRTARFDEAIADVRAVQGDPAGIAPAILAILESAQSEE